MQELLNARCKRAVVSQLVDQHICYRESWRQCIPKEGVTCHVSTQGEGRKLLLLLLLYKIEDPLLPSFHCTKNTFIQVGDERFEYLFLV